MINEIRQNQVQTVQKTEPVALPSEESSPEMPIPPARALMNLVSGKAREITQQMEKSARLLETLRNTPIHSLLGL